MWPPDDRVRRAFAETARKYDDIARRRFRRIAAEVVRAARPTRRDEILDIACGSGLVARVLTELALPEPVGLDISEKLLDLAPMRVKTVGDAQSLPFRAKTFSVVLCNLGLQMLPDPDIGLVEMHRVLRPGGRAGLSIWGENDRSSRIDGRVIGDLDAVLRSRSDYDEKRWQTVQTIVDTPDDLQDAMREAGFEQVSVEVRKKRSGFKGAGDYLRMLEVFPALWSRLEVLGEEKDEARGKLEIAIEEEVGHAGHFEMTEEVLIASGEKPK